MTKRSESDETVRAYTWSPDGTALLYQTSLIDDSGLRLVDLEAGTDEEFLDLPGSEQSLGYFDNGRDAWGDRGILFEDEGHGVIRTENRVEYIDRVAGFFQSTLVDR